MSDEQTLEQRLSDAHYRALTERAELHAAINDRVGLVRKYTGDDPALLLVNMIENHAKAVARIEMLTIMSSVDFYDAICMSAGGKQ